MKKIAVSVIACLLLTVFYCYTVAESDSAHVVFGCYEQDNNLQNGAEPIEWIVLDTQDNRQLLISRYALDCMRFSDDAGAWNASAVRAWLNNEFLSAAFSEEEQQAIIASEISNSSEETNAEWASTDNENTLDKVFLLSFAEARRYFETDGSRKVKGTSYAKSRGAAPKDVTSIVIGETDWWLRSQGATESEASFVDVRGWTISKPAKEELGIRPVLWLDLNCDFNTFRDARYASSIGLADQGDDLSAVEAFDALGNYRDSYLQGIQSRVRIGNQALEAGNLTDAIRWFSDAKSCILDHFDADTSADMLAEYDVNARLLESRYQQAVDVKNSGDTDRAIELLTEIGHYKDSMDLLRECFDQNKIRWSWLTRKTDSTVNAGMDTGYSKSSPIKDGDPHFGWYLGRFMISGYTERVDEGDVPVFIKTPGDNLVLWFNLEQDIDALNQDENLQIVQDKNGSDQQFQIPKSDFGRGALFIKHIDARNSDTDPQEYKDYLAAHDDSGANTRVEIKEEGVYEVALDYEIAKKSKVVLVDKWDYHNYRICFTFEVRNGSSMFYLFDLGSGTELQDYSATADGFRIDLANSHALSINYTRYALNQSGTGLDVRKATVASDGDEFTTVGYYEITATNKETDEKLTKHVFIGDAEDLAMYKDADTKLLSRFE